MRTPTILIALALGLALGLPGASASEQAGENGDCLDYLVLFLVDGLFSPGAATITATAGADYSVGTDADATVYVDFYDAEGTWLDWNEGEPQGQVPDGATQGTICVGGTLGAVLFAGVTWTYNEA